MEFKVWIGCDCCKLFFNDCSFGGFIKQKLKNFISRKKSDLTVFVFNELVEDEREIMKRLGEFNLDLIKIGSGRERICSKPGEEVFTSIKLNEVGAKIIGNRFKGEFNLKRKTGRVFISHPYFYNEKELRLFLRACYSLYSFKNTLVLHASSVSQSGLAIVFAGGPGQGKTTLADLAGGQLINDETSLLRKKGKSFFLYSNPFGESDFNAQGSPVKTIYFIKKHKRTSKRELSFEEKLERLLLNDFLNLTLSLPDKKKILQERLGLYLDLIGQTPCYELSFNLKDKRRLTEYL